MRKITFLCLVFLFACRHTDDIPVRNPVTENIPEPEMKPFEVFRQEIRLLEGSGDIRIDGVYFGTMPLVAGLPQSVYEVQITSEGKPDFRFPLEVSQASSRIIRYPGFYESKGIRVEPLGVFSCGASPKQAHFSPCGRYVYLPLLSDTGFQVFDTLIMKMTAHVGPERYSRKKGFVEGLFIPGYKSFFISQMTTGMIFEYDASEPFFPVLKRGVKTGGTWSKVIATNHDSTKLAVSNWTSHNVSILEYETGKILALIDGIREPRGLAFSPDGEYLYICSYLDGGIHKIKTSDWKSAAVLELPRSATRHLVLNADGSLLYASDMNRSRIHEINTSEFRILRTWQMYMLTNTIVLDHINNRIYASDRGPNNPKGYLYKSENPGRIHAIDLEKGEIVLSIETGTQPTGLDISPDGTMLVSTNFQDNTIELFRIHDN